AAVAHIALDQGDVAVGERPVEVGAASADEVVEHDDLRRSRFDQLVDERRADRAAAAGDEYPLVLEHLFLVWLGAVGTGDGADRDGQLGNQRRTRSKAFAAISSSVKRDDVI